MRDIPKVIHFRYEQLADDISVKPPLNDAELHNLPVDNTVEVEVETAEAEAIVEDIYDAIKAREDEGYRVTRLVLGVEHYLKLDVLFKYGYDTPPEKQLPVDEIITVPGDVIEPVISNRERVAEHLEEMEDERDD